MDSLSSAPGADLLVPYAYPPSLSAMRVTPSGLRTIYKGFLQFRQRVVITRVACFRRGLFAALPDIILFTRDSGKFVRARSLLASEVASSVTAQVLRSHFGVFGSLTRDPFDHSAFSEATNERQISGNRTGHRPPNDDSWLRRLDPAPV